MDWGLDAPPLLQSLVQCLSGVPDIEVVEFEAVQNVYSIALQLMTDPVAAAALRDDIDAAIGALDYALLRRAEALDSGNDSARLPGYSRLLFYWLTETALQLSVRQPVPTYAAELGRRGLLTTGGGAADVPYMSLRQVCLAMRVFLQRLYLQPDSSDVLEAYYGQLQMRLAEFAHNAIEDEAEYDLPILLEEGRPGPRFTRAAAWWSLAVRRALVAWKITAPSSPLLCEMNLQRSVRVQRIAARDAVWPAILQHTARMEARSYYRNFQAMAHAYCILPYECTWVTSVHNLGMEQGVNPRRVLIKNYPPNQALYICGEKFSREFADWLRIAVNPLHPATALESFIAALGGIFVLNAYFLSHYRCSIIDCAVILLEPTAGSFDRTLHDAMRRNYPVFVQRLGCFAVGVPRFPNLGVRAFEELAGIAIDARTPQYFGGGTLYACPTIDVAISLWAAALWHGWRGKLGETDASEWLRPLFEARAPIRINAKLRRK